MKNPFLAFSILMILAWSSPAYCEIKEGDLFDNMGMDLMLHDALRLADEHEFERSKQKWNSVIEFMHSPNWIATAAIVPICSKFAFLADKNLARNEDTDADKLLRAAFDFPFHKRGEEVQVDAISVKLLDNYKKKNQTEQSKEFLKYAISKTNGQRQSEYKAKLDQMTQVISQESKETSSEAAGAPSPDLPPTGGSIEQKEPQSIESKVQ